MFPMLPSLRAILEHHRRRPQEYPMPMHCCLVKKPAAPFWDGHVTARVPHLRLEVAMLPVQSMRRKGVSAEARGEEVWPNLIL